MRSGSPPLPRLEPVVHNNSNTKFCNLISYTTEVFTPLCVFLFWNWVYSHFTYIHWEGYEWSGIKIGSKGEKELKGVRTSAVEEIRLQNYLWRESQWNTSLLISTGHCEVIIEYLYLGKLMVGKLEIKFCFHQRYLYSTS
jgi:hypothetical protein